MLQVTSKCLHPVKLTLTLCNDLSQFCFYGVSGAIGVSCTIYGMTQAVPCVCGWYTQTNFCLMLNIFNVSLIARATKCGSLSDDMVSDMPNLGKTSLHRNFATYLDSGRDAWNTSTICWIYTLLSGYISFSLSVGPCPNNLSLDVWMGHLMVGCLLVGQKNLSWYCIFHICHTHSMFYLLSLP